ncbi:PAS domain-containing protein [Streptomyces sp. NPDC057694]|uniref:sensor histidine kinase n=1 Tax=Streptomyces sp. NPDC057694 TaxID=3346216 RepID=UPI003697CA0B
MTSIADDLGSILDVMDQPVLALDAGHQVVYANPAAAGIMGYDSPSDLVGAAARPDPNSVVLEPGRSLFGPERPLPERGRGTIARADGSRIAIEWLLLPLPRTGGTTAVYVLRRAAGSEGHASQGAVEQPGPLAMGYADRQRRTAEILQHGVQERLAGVLIALGLVEEGFDAGGGNGTAGLLSEAIRDAQEALALVRQATAAIHPGVLRVRGLRTAVSVLAARCALPVTVTGSLAGRLPDAVELHLYFLVEAALERAARYSDATSVRIRLDADADIVVSVVDDGRRHGRDEGQLAAVACRVAWLGGSLEVGSTAGPGGTVRAVIPLRGSSEH